MMDKEEFIQNYIANRLSEDEKTQFEALLKTDKELQELYETHVTMAAAFKLSKTNEIKQRLQQLDSATETPKTKGFIQKNLSKIAIAAVFVLGIFFAVNQFTAKEDFFNSYFEVCPNTYLPVTRGTTTQNELIEGFRAYESKNYEKAAAIFNDILKESDDTTTRFYYAMSLLNQKKFDLALAELNAIQAIAFDYKVESLWYAALIELKNGNEDKAAKHLKAIQNLNSDFKSDEIQAILNTLK